MIKKEMCGKKESYVTPFVDVVTFDTEDVIVTSPNTDEVETDIYKGGWN